MNSATIGTPTRLIAISAGIVAVGIAVDSGFTVSIRTVPAFILISVGLFGVVTAVGDRPLEYLQITAKRWWMIAFLAFLPYGIVTAPSSTRSIAVGNVVSESIAAGVFEAVAGATILCAIATTALYAVAWYGIHPGRPTPEERVLNDANGD